MLITLVDDEENGMALCLGMPSNTMHARISPVEWNDYGVILQVHVFLKCSVERQQQPRLERSLLDDAIAGWW